MDIPALSLERLAVLQRIRRLKELPHFLDPVEYAALEAIEKSPQVTELQKNLLDFIEKLNGLNNQ